MIKEKMIFALLGLCSLGACAQKKTIYNSPQGYDLNHPVRFVMPDALQEISGIDFKDGDPGTLYAEQDEEGKVYLMKLGDKKAHHVKFGDKGDYEDLALVGKFVVMLRSDGVLYDFPFDELRAGKIDHTSKWNDLLPKGEYESLYGDPATGELVLLTKDSHSDTKARIVSGYVLILHTDGSITRSNEFQFSPASLAAYSGMHHAVFKPSALTRNSRNGEWYILSSVNKILVVTDSLWHVREVCRLDPSLFIQPEGIAFDKDGALYISNEGDKHVPGTVLKFPFHRIR